MNGNDYLEIEENQYENIVQDYCEKVMDGSISIPDDFIHEWITNHIAGLTDAVYDRMRDDL